MTEPFAAYVRTSTEDNQSPEDSKRWQLSLAEQLIGPKNGKIIQVYHDIDISRSLPWSRRPQARALLADLSRRDRGWAKLVIGEPQRAFSGPQFQLVFPILSHHGVELWVPEVGGALDPDSEAHDLVMSLFGGLSKAERRRIQHRTRASMLALAATGRWLGGRTNYGYQLIDTDLPHPNRRKAAAGARLRTLEPDRETAPVVQRIFDMYDQGFGIRSIAQVLEREGLLSPGEFGPTRHPRSAGVWSGSAVRAILMNPRYLGRQVAGRLRRHDELVDATDAALGTTSRQRWQEREAWAWSEEIAWPALVDEELWDRVNARLRNNPTTRPRQARSEPGRYLLSGLVRCGHCGKSMNGATMKSKPYYRCTATRPQYAVPSVPDHPPTYAVREERITAALDQWLADLAAPQNLDVTVAAILDADAQKDLEPAHIANARRREQQLNTELDRMLAAIRAGMDPQLAASETRKIQAEIATVTDLIHTWESSGDRSRPLTRQHVLDALGAAGDLVRLLGSADRVDRAELYRTLGLRLKYEKEAATGRELVHVRSQLRSSGGRI